MREVNLADSWTVRVFSGLLVASIFIRALAAHAEQSMTGAVTAVGEIVFTSIHGTLLLAALWVAFMKWQRPRAFSYIAWSHLGLFTGALIVWWALVTSALNIVNSLTKNLQ